MKKKRKTLQRIIVVFMAVAMIAGILAACGGGSKQNETTTGAEEKTTGKAEETTVQVPNKPSTWVSDSKLEVTMLFHEEANTPYKAEWPIWKYIEDMTNVKLKVQVSPATDHINKVKLLLSAGSAPDIITRIGSAGVKYEETILDIAPYLDKMPNMMSAINKFKYDIKLMKNADGRIFQLPQLFEVGIQTHALFIRSDLRKEFGMEVPKTVDDLFDYMKKCKEKYPDSFPLSQIWKEDHLYYGLGPSFGTWLGWNVGQDQIDISPITGEIKHWPSSNETREMLRYLNKLHKNGLIDPEFVTQTDDAWKNKMATNKAFVSWHWMGSMDDVVKAAKEAGNDIEFEPVLPLDSSVTHGWSCKTWRGGLVWGINAAIKDNPRFDDILKFIDILYYNKEMQERLYLGIKDEHYTEDTGGNLLRAEKYDVNKGVSSNLIKRDFGISLNDLNGYREKKWAYIDYDKRTLDFVSALVDSGKVTISENVDLRSLLTNEESERFSVKNAPRKEYIDSMMLNFIFGRNNIDNDWDAYVKECENKGSKELLEFYKKKYEEYKANQK